MLALLDLLYNILNKDRFEFGFHSEFKSILKNILKG